MLNNNQCEALLGELTDMVHAGGPRLPVAMGKGIVNQLETCLEDGYITQSQYEQALRDIAQVNQVPDVPPEPVVKSPVGPGRL